jgi:hypothetical protein
MGNRLCKRSKEFDKIRGRVEITFFEDSQLIALGGFGSLGDVVHCYVSQPSPSLLPIGRFTSNAWWRDHGITHGKHLRFGHVRQIWKGLHCTNISQFSVPLPELGALLRP